MHMEASSMLVFSAVKPHYTMIRRRTYQSVRTLSSRLLYDNRWLMVVVVFVTPTSLCTVVRVEPIESYAASAFANNFFFV